MRSMILLCFLLAFSLSSASPLELIVNQTTLVQCETTECPTLSCNVTVRVDGVCCEICVGKSSLYMIIMLIIVYDYGIFFIPLAFSTGWY